MSTPSTKPPASKVYSSRVVIAGLMVPAVLAVLLFSWWPRPKSSRQHAVPLPPGAGSADDGSRVLGVLELGAPLGWVHLGDYRNARWVTRNFSGWGVGLPVIGTAVSPIERASVRGGAPDAAGRIATVTGHVDPGDTLAILVLRVPDDGGAVWARVASGR